MNRRIKTLILFSLSTCYHVFFIYASLSGTRSNFWGFTILAAFLTASYIGEIYMFYHWKYAEKKEKHRVSSQQSTRRYFFDRWYTPADSTELDNQEEKLRKIKRTREKRVRRK